MPIRADLLPFYRGPAWREARRKVLERAGGRFDDDGRYLGGAHCEQCYVPDRAVAWRCGACWFDWTLRMWFDGEGQPSETPANQDCRFVWIVLTIGHRNHRSGDDRPKNLRAWCQWCHNHYDQGHRKETRCTRKDASRPLLTAHP